MIGMANTSPSRLWSLAQTAGDAGWDVTARRTPPQRTDWQVQLIRPNTPLVVTATWAFRPATSPTAKGTWRISTVTVAFAADTRYCRVTELVALVAAPPNPGITDPAAIAGQLAPDAVAALEATRHGQVSWDSRFPAQPDKTITDGTVLDMSPLLMPVLRLWGLVRAGELRTRQPLSPGRQDWDIHFYQLTDLGRAVLAVTQPQEIR